MFSFVPYCSSDAWSGNVSRYESGGSCYQVSNTFLSELCVLTIITIELSSGKFSFMGYRIINEVIKELLTQGLLDAKHLLLAGSR